MTRYLFSDILCRPPVQPFERTFEHHCEFVPDISTGAPCGAAFTSTNKVEPYCPTCKEPARRRRIERASAKARKERAATRAQKQQRSAISIIWRQVDAHDSI